MTKKDSVLNAAKDLFGRYGYNDTTFKKIAEKAGVAVGLLSHHYGNKERLFFAAGMDVLDHFIDALRNSVAMSDTGLDGVVAFAETYLSFSLDPQEHFLVLVRCSPYSDMKASDDREAMIQRFTQVPALLETCVARGVQDGSIRKELPVTETAGVVQCSLVGAVRTKLLTPYSPPSLYEETVRFVRRSLTL